jgi:hypothetical protein
LKIFFKSIISTAKLDNPFEILSAPLILVKIESNIEKSKEELAKAIVAEWEKTVGLQMELVMYKAMHIRDVNNYLSIYEDSSVKMKGAYEFLDLAWHKNFSALVIPMAVSKHIIEGLDYRNFLHQHKDAYDFMLRVKVPRNCSLVLVDEELETEKKLQNVCRYYGNQVLLLYVYLQPLG